MLILQLSAGQGPAECSLAVYLAFLLLEKEAAQAKVTLSVLESMDGPVRRSLSSVLIALDGQGSESLATRWNGTLQWICQSPLRPKHNRKNWFIGCQSFEESKELPHGAVTFQACRSSGAGGQHVNKTNSAVRATHVATGLSVKVQTERSQHANKRIAKALIAHKLEELKLQQSEGNAKERWHAHWQLERGNPIRVFRGEKFREV